MEKKALPSQLSKPVPTVRGTGGLTTLPCTRGLARRPVCLFLCVCQRPPQANALSVRANALDSAWTTKLDATTVDQTSIAALMTRVSDRLDLAQVHSCRAVVCGRRRHQHI